jgi:hypothetical protein
MKHRAGFARSLATGLVSSLALGATSCGGGGSGGNNSGAAMVLVSFLQAGEDNVPLNRVLEFTFSASVDVATVDQGSIQIRKGPLFGQSVEGRFLVQGAKIFFEPKLPSTCTLEDAGFTADTDYRVTLIGSPEEFALRSTTGDPLESTISFSFHTRTETDPSGLFEDQVPGVFPFVVTTSPSDGARPPDPDVAVGPGNRVRIEFSENIDPCSISATTVRFNQWAVGDPTDFPNGFDPDADQTPGDPFSWGSGTPQIPPQRIRSQYVLTQNFVSTRLDIIPDFGEFPDNALLVVEVTSDVRDFGGIPAIPKTFAFVTENRAQQCQARLLKFDGDVPVNTDLSTADVDTARAPDRAQGFLLFAGDGDNGATTTIPSGPACIPWEQVNDGTPDDLDVISADIVLDTGASLNTQCDNEVDGSRAVVFEFRTFRIRAPRTVKLVGRNPAIILVSGDVLIESGAKLLVKSDGTAGTPSANGLNGTGGTQPVAGLGGRGILGGGSGGAASAGGSGLSGTIYSSNGEAGFGSPDFGTPGGMGGLTDPVLIGPGRGAVNTGHTMSNSQVNRFAAGGGGGGHATAGGNGNANGNGQSPTFNDGGGFVDAAGGGTYGDPFGKMPTPESGSGAGGGGLARAAFGGSFSAPGGGGGAGGGFIDLTSSGTIKIFGTIDASGGMGGGGGQSFSGGGGGGGGGSGGGVRLLTPISIQVASTTTISAIGGIGGSGTVGSVGTAFGAVANSGGQGGLGRLVFEDGDSVIEGYAGAAINPGETSSAGFYRGLFDAARFQGGGLTPQLVTGLIDMGPTFPTYVEPVQVYGGQEDFVAGIPAVASRGVGATSILIEVQGFPVTSDGSIDQTDPSGWSRIGYFTDSGAESFPTWNLGTPGDVTLPPGSVGGGFAHVNQHEFIQFRITFFLKSNVGPFDPGPFLDDWTIHFCYDQ